MKCTFLIIGLCLSTLTSFAQLGVKAGIDFSSIARVTGIYEVGASAGVTYDIKLSKKTYFQPGLLFASNGFKFEPIEGFLKKAHVHMYALEAPLIVSIRPTVGNKTNLIVDLGLYARYNLFGKEEYEYTDNSVKGSPFDAYQRFDMGINLGFGLSYHRYSITGSYQHGFTTAEKGLNGPHRKIRISLGYLF